MADQDFCEGIGPNTWAGPGTTCPDDCNACGPADGDMNGDLATDGKDITLFIDGILNGATPEQVCHGDFDGMNGLDTGDVPLMVAALLAG